MNRNIDVSWSNENCTWPGDVKRYRYNIEKVTSLGWKYQYDSAEAVVKTIQNILKLYK